jgi:16S rRNA (cytosine967-C5)-methyltransferase
VGTQPDRTETPVNRPPRGPRSTDFGAPADAFVPGLAARMAAARLLAAVVDARTPLDGLTDNDHGHPQFRGLDMRDRSLVRAILATALRFRRTIEALISARLDNKLPGNATTLVHILHVAAAQILFLDIPDSAAVDLAVTHAKSDPRTKRFSGLVNGLLRGLARGKDADLPKALESTADAPDWFIARMTDAYGAEKTAQILRLQRLEGATDFTVKGDPARWAEALGGIVLPTGSVRVARLAGPVAELPGYDDGAWWVQDAAAALPARLFGDIAGLRVADLCAAPGGKTAQLVAAGAKVTAIDSSKNRIVRLGENLKRLGLEAEIVQADILTYEPPQLFDAVLVDAPCSSTGTIRRHPDVLWTKTSDDVAKLADLQLRLLLRAAGMVRPGGRIVFSNCSLDPLEGEKLIEKALAGGAGLVADPVREGEIAAIDAYLNTDGQLRTTPADLAMAEPVLSGLDGFFAARLKRAD